MKFAYRPGMGARGLHLDIERGWLMKVDSYHNIQLDTVYQSVRVAEIGPFSTLTFQRDVPDDEVIAAHHGTRLPVDLVGYLGKTSDMYQFVDIFSSSEVTLLRDVIQVNSEPCFEGTHEAVHSVV